MTFDLLLILVGLGLLYAGAESLVRGSSALALRLGLSPLVIGLTVVAYGTSMPEMVVSLNAAIHGQSAIAVGNVVGSNIFNIAVILGLAAVIFPIRIQFQLLRLDVPIMIASTLLVMFFIRDGRLDRPEAVVLFLGIIAYTVFSLITARRTSSPAVEAEYQEMVPSPRGPVLLNIFWILLGLGLMIGGSKCLVDGAVALARAWGLSEAVIGLTIVAAGTSTPELAATLVAAFKREADIAVGNIIGSNIYNLLAILGVTGIISPIETSSMAAFDLWMMLGLGILLVPFMWSGFILKRWEGGVLLAIYGGFLIWHWPK